MKKIIILVIILAILVASVFLIRSWLNDSLMDGPDMENPPIVTIGENIGEENFQEFFYTYSATFYPPEFQRYRFYTEGGKYYFYHETREGEEVFLSECHITECGIKELTQEEWSTFWNFICQGEAQIRNDDASSDDSGTWLYIYLNGDYEDYQEFHFIQEGTLLSFEAFCQNLKESAECKFVRTVGELVDAIDNNTSIVLAPGDYNLTQWLIEKSYIVEEYDEQIPDALCGVCYKFSDDYEFCIANISGLVITSQYNENLAHLISEANHGPAIQFLGGSNNQLRDVRITQAENDSQSQSNINYINCEINF